ncbi:MAG TPA: hypothetical protein VNX46_03125, partial [Candidatus Acidoferrum sp.]|nr:hypothetical protein [Candidatus Acidoferrum sp.]
SWLRRVILFIVVLFIQESVFFFVPPRATAELMGIAHRLQRDLSPDQFRNCANQLRMRFHTGTLKLGDRGGDDDNYFPADSSAVVVEDTELPASLRGRFQRIFIETDPSTGNEAVIFAVDHETGIICEDHVRAPYYAYPIADGVEAYQDHP